jgi:transposase
MSVIIGIDPHKALHAACVIDNSEVELGELLVRTGPRQLSELLAWRHRSTSERGRSSRPVGSATSSPSSSSRTARMSLTCRRHCRRECACSARDGRTRTTPTMPAPLPLLRCGHRSSPTSVPRTMRACCACWPRRSSTRHERAAAPAAGSTHWCASWCRAGSASKSLPHKQIRPLPGSSRSTPPQRQRLELAHETVDEIRLLDAKLTRSRARITDAVTASGTSLTDVYGVGPIIAALLIGYTGDATRFPTAGHFAAYNGTAPIEFSSSGRTVHRLSRRGNRTLNHAIHMIAVTQIRHLDSEGPATTTASSPRAAPSVKRCAR